MRPSARFSLELFELVERTALRLRSLSALIAVTTIAIAAAPTPVPTPAPKAAPAKAPAAKPSPSALPTTIPQTSLPLVIVFPFDTSTDIKAGTGEAAAQVFVRQMNAEGGVDTIQGPPSVKRADFLQYARTINAAYYLSGYMTPLADGVSLVEQVVSTRSGAIVFGQTAQISSIEDATAQATYIHDGLIAREKQLADAYNEAQGQATPTPSNGSNEAKADIGKGLGAIANLFRHGRGATPAPAVKKPEKGVFVAHVSGALPANDLSKATSELLSALNQRFNTRPANVPGSTLTKAADTVCGSDRNNTIATGTLSAQSSHHGLGSRITYEFKLQMYTCFGAVLAEATGTGDSASSAIRKAVDSYASEHPQNS